MDNTTIRPISVDLENASISEDELLKFKDEVKRCDELLRAKTGKGNDFLGWIDYPLYYDKKEFDEIKDLVNDLKDDGIEYNTVVVCGIGGSYLGTRACVEMVQGLLSDNPIKMLYIGNTMSSNYVDQVLNYLKKEDVNFVVNCISKSGTTTETAIAFRLVCKLAYKKYGNDASKRIFVTTSKDKGVLKDIAKANGYKSFTIPDDIGGRYSVLTSVGILPLALCGINIDDIMSGAVDAYHDLNNNNLLDNPAYIYAVARRILNDRKFVSEFFVSYHPQYQMFAEWWKQLFGESEGKDGKGIFPTSAIYSTDLHSMGQFVQEGSKVLFETVLNVQTLNNDVKFTKFNEDDSFISKLIHKVDFDDKMDYLEGKTLDFANDAAFKGTLKAHVDGGIPNIIINIIDNSEYNFGYLVYFFFLACGMSCYLLDVNPFNQPGVEVYKKNMFKLLGKE